MPYDSPTLDEYGPTDRLGSLRHNKLIKAVNGLTDVVAKNLGIVRDGAAPLFITDIFPAVIRSSGPNGEADYTDARYWFDVALPDPTLLDTDLISVSADTIFPETGTATNFTELVAGSLVGSTHGLLVNAQILIFCISSRRDDPVPAYIFVHGGILPKGQYQGMVFQMITQNKTGFDFVSSHAIDT